MAYDIFISYKRTRSGSSGAAAAYIYDFLKRKGYSVFFDRSEMGQGKFNEQLYGHIENAQEVIVLLEEGSLVSCFDSQGVSASKNYDGDVPGSSELEAGEEGYDQTTGNRNNPENKLTENLAASDDNAAYKTDWFCREIMHAIKLDKRIIPLRLNGYVLPKENLLPIEMRALVQNEAPEFYPHEMEVFFETYFVRKKGFFLSKPKNVFLAENSEKSVADFLFYSSSDCEVFERGNVVGSLNQNYNDECPCVFSAARAGEHRFKVKNYDTCEQQVITVSIERYQQLYVPIVWQMHQNLWDLTPEIIESHCDSKELFFWGKGLFEGNVKHSPNYELAFMCLNRSIKAWNAEAKSFIVDNVQTILREDAARKVRISWLEAAAKFNSCEANFALSKRYHNGSDGVGRDDVKSAFYARCGADLGDERSMNSLAIFYFKGLGVEKDLEQSHKLFQEATKKGNVKAAANLGMHYLEGHFEVENGIEEGLNLLHEAFEKDPSVGVRLGKIYFWGDFGVEQNTSKAIDILERSASRNVIQAYTDLGDIYLMGADDLEIDRKRGIDCYKKAISLGDTSARVSLGRKYFYGEDGIEQDIEKGLKLIEEAAELNDACAYNLLGKIYLAGDNNVEKNVARGIAYYEKSAELNDTYALRLLGVKYHRGTDDIGRDVEKGLAFLSKAASLDDPYANGYLGNAYLKGMGADRDTLKALAFLERAVELDESPAMKILGEAYFYGRHLVERNTEKGLMLLNKAASLSNVSACLKLGEIYCDGDGVDADEVKGINFYEEAFALGSAAAAIELALIYSLKKQESDDYAEKELKYLAAAELRAGPTDFYCLGNIYCDGCDGIEKNIAKGLDCLERAADLGSSQAAEELGLKYFYAKDGVPQDIQKGLMYLEKATAKPTFQLRVEKLLGNIYLQGINGVEKNETKGIEYLERTMRNNRPQVCEALVSYYVDRMDYSSLIRYYKLGVDSDVGGVLDILLSIMYKKGIGTEKDENESKKYELAGNEKIGKKSYARSRRYNQIAWTLHLMHEPEEALAWTEKLNAEKNTDSNELDTIACVYKDLGRYEEAIAIYQKAAALGRTQAKEDIEIVKKLLRKSKRKKKS